MSALARLMSAAWLMMALTDDPISLCPADTCAICRNKLYEPSIEAQASEH